MKGMYKGQSLLCPHCTAGVEESPAHWLSFNAYTDLRVGLDPELVVEDRARFLGKAIARREKLEKELKEK